MKKTSKPNLVIFDGSNFYYGAKRLSLKTHLTSFNYVRLVEEITGRKDNKIEYCAGEVLFDKHSLKTQKLFSSQQTLFYNLERQGIEIKKGYLLRHKRLLYHEKGVDVRIALDILKGAIKDEYNKCYLISSDTDIIPAIIDARECGKEIIYVGFENSISRALKKNCSKTVIISKKMIVECGKKALAKPEKAGISA